MALSPVSAQTPKVVQLTPEQAKTLDTLSKLKFSGYLQLRYDMLLGDSSLFKSQGGGGTGNDRGTGGGKTVSARELDTKTPQEKATFFAANPGITVTD